MDKSKIANRKSEILGLHSGALGDVVLFAQLLCALKARDGGRVRLIAGGEKARLLAGLGAADEAIDFNSLPMDEVFSDRPASQCRLSLRLGEAPRAGRLLVSCFVAGDEQAQRRLAEICSAGRAVFLPVRPPENFTRHLLDFWAQQMQLASVPVPRWPTPADWRKGARDILLSEGVSEHEPYVLIHPGAGSSAKCWPVNRFVSLAEALGKSMRKAVFVVGPVEQEQWGAKKIESASAEFPLVLAPNLEVLAGLVGEAVAYVGNDSGPSHLAAVMGVPSIVLFGPTNSVHFAPRGRAVRLLCGRLAELPVERVLEALELF